MLLIWQFANDYYFLISLFRRFNYCQLRITIIFSQYNVTMAVEDILTGVELLDN